MPIFPVVEVEEKLQVNDKTRIDASKSYAAAETITKIEIKPSASDAFFDTGLTGILDWQYGAAADNVVTVKITTTETPAGTTSTKTITSVTAATDNLFSTDDELRKFEPDILKWVPAGRSSFKDVHRAAQALILGWFSEQGIRKTNGLDPIGISDVTDVSEVREWATFLALRLIYEGISNAVDDVFMAKSKKYKGLEVAARNRGVYSFDVDGDTEQESGEKINSWSGSLVRR